PLGNTFGPALPFVGIVAQAFDVGGKRADDVFGKATAGARDKYAIGGLPPGMGRVTVRLLARAVRLVLGWKLRGQGWPHPYFDRATRKPTRPISVLSPDQRDALRPLCGPDPSPR
ncbi:MAG: DUF6151 family protein, partial [Polyangiaceae bacterium]